MYRVYLNISLDEFVCEERNVYQKKKKKKCPCNSLQMPVFCNCTGHNISESSSLLFLCVVQL